MIAPPYLQSGKTETAGRLPFENLAASFSGISEGFNLKLNAKERFERVRAAVYRLHDVQLLIMNGCEDWRPQTVRARRQVPDPTANAAIYHVDQVEKMLHALKVEESELLRTIGAALVIIQGVRDGLGDKYADVLEWRYIDCRTWEYIRDEYGVSRRTGNRRANVAFDWADSIGVTRILAGDFEI